MTSAAVPTSSRVISLPLAEVPGINAFALDLVHGRDSASRYVHRGRFDAIRPPGAARGRTRLVEALVRANEAWGNDVAAGLRAWERGETVTIVAGQQVGFAGGPIYTLAKIASLLKIKRELARSGVDATLFFWLATEDHDYDEVARIALPASFGRRAESPHARDGVVTLHAAERARKAAVGAMPLPESLRRNFLDDAALEAIPRWLRPGISFADSFAELIASAIPRSIVLVDALLPELRREAAPFLVSLAGSLAEANRLVRDRSAELAAAGYAPQVQPRDGGEYPILFRLDDAGGREAIETAGDGAFRIDGRAVDRESLCRLVEEKPESISTGVLARPLLQDIVFRPDIFVGGPAEVAYYAQLTPLHERFGIPQPHVALRGHALVAPEKILRAIDRYGVEHEELFHPVETILRRRETAALATLAESLARAEERIVHEIETVGPALVAIDPTLARPVGRSLERIRHQFDKLGEKGRRAVARRDRDRHQSIVRLCDTLAPGGTPQDRLVGWIGYWMIYGDRLVQRIVDEIEPDRPIVKVVGL